MKLVMTPGPSAEQVKKRQALSLEEQDAIHANKVAASRASPEGLLMDQSTNFGETTAPKLVKHVDILKPAMAKMRETYPATFAFMRYQWSRLPPSMRIKMISESSDYKTLYEDPDMKPFTEWLHKLEGTGTVENELRRVARRAVMAEKIRAADLWQEADAALAELRANEAVLDLMIPELPWTEEIAAAFIEEGEENSTENVQEIYEEIQEFIEAEANDPEAHLVLHYAVEPRESIDPTGNLERLLDPEPLSDVDYMTMVEQRGRLNRILLGFKRNVLADMPEVDRTELLDIYKDAIVEPTDPAELEAWNKRMAVAARQIEAAHEQGLTTHTAYRESLEEFKADNNTDFVPNPVALRLLLDSMQEIPDDYHPELKRLLEEFEPEQAEEILIERAEIDYELQDERRSMQIEPTLEADEEDVSEADIRLDLAEHIDDADEEELSDALHPDYSDLVIKELTEPLFPLSLPMDEEARSSIMETFEAHLKAYTQGTELDAKYLTEEDKEVDTAFNASSEQALAVVKKIMHLPDTNVRDLSRAVLLDHARHVMSDLGFSVHDEDMVDFSILEQIQRIRHDLNTQLNSPDATAEDRENAEKVMDLLDSVEGPIKEEGDYMPVDDPNAQFEDTKLMLQATKDLLVEYNAELNNWESRIDTIFSYAREATSRMLDPVNADKNPSWVNQLKEMHEKVYGTSLPNPLASITSDDVMAEWSRAVKEQIVFEEARSKVQRERDAVQHAFARQMGPITTVHQPAAPADTDNGYYPFSSSDIESERPLEERIYIPQDLELDQIFTESNVGRYITFSERDLKKYLPEGFSLHLTRREFAQTKTKSILLRKQALEAIANLKAQEAAGFIIPQHKANSDDSSIPKPMMLHGHNGCGKSAVLSEVVYWARRSGWLVVYIPDANAYLSSGVYIAKNAQEGTWDQPKLFVRLFSHLIAAHSDKLKEIPLAGPTKIGKIVAHNLFDVVEYGSVLEQYSAQCFTVFKTEIKKVTQFPVLFAVDAYNALYTPSQAFRDPEVGAYHKDPLNPYNMTFGRMLYDAHVDHKLVNGTFIGAVSESVPLRAFVHHKPDPKLHGSIVQPKYLEVVPYTKSEFTTVMEHYKHTNWVRTEMSSGSASELYIYQLTSGFPGAVWSYAKRL